MTESERMLKFSVGDNVLWTSSAGGKTATKFGKVIAVVPPYSSCREAMQKAGLKSRVDQSGAERDHESFVVRAHAGGSKRSRLYWPRVSALAVAALP